MHARIMALLLLCGLALSSTATAQERFGTLTGKITDQQGAAVPGVTISTTNNATGEARVFVSDANGQYIAPDLNPGRYTVTFELSGFSKISRNDVSVVLGRTFELNAQMMVGAVTETVEVTAEVNPLVDTRSTLIAHNVSSEEIDLLPKGRSFQSIALTAPSVNSGDLEGGFQVNGASGAENSFTVDGVVTNSLLYGSSRQNTVFEYLEEVQVKTSGIAAEYGGALGGVMSAVTKSGGNVFRGEGHYYFEGSALSAAPSKRLNLDPLDDTTVRYVNDAEDPSHQNEFGGSVGGPIIRNRLFFFGSFSPRNENTTRDYSFTDGPSSVTRDVWKQQAFGKLSFSSRRMNASWSTLWTPTKAHGTLDIFKASTPNSISAPKSSIAIQPGRGYEINQVNTSGTVDLNVTNTSFVRIRSALFHDRYSDTGIPETTSYSYSTPTTPLNSIIPPALQGGTNAGGVNTPRAQITSFDTTRRETFDIDYNHVISAAGLHTVKAGFGYQHVSNDVNSYYPGGYVNIFWDRSFVFNGVTTGRGTYGYYEVNNRRISNKTGASIKSLYAQDSWTLGNHLTLDLGLRAEHELVPTFRPDYLKYAFDFGWGDKLAPRLGAAYDLFGNGRAKIFGSWGRYFDWTKYELVRATFGAETWCIDYRALDTLDLGSLSLTNKPGRDLWTTPGTCRDRRVPSFADTIDPATKPMSQDSISSGLEYQLDRSSVLTVHYIHNNLRDTIEDIGFLDKTGNEGYLIGNPGKGQTKFQFPTGKTPPGQVTPLVKRQYDALELGINRRYSNNYFFSVNYTLSRLYGNYSGIGSSDEITTAATGVTGSATSQQQTGSVARPGANDSRAWDLDELLWDSHGNLDLLGRLATDRPHVVKAYGSYQAPFGTQFGAFFYGGSGTPMTTYVMSTNTSGGVGSMVEGRGNMGRTPALTRTDVLVSHELALVGTKKMRFELNVLNVFNQKTARHIWNGLNFGTGAGLPRPSAAIDLSGTDLTKGYDYNALILKSPDGAHAYDPRYKNADLFDPGTRAYVTVKFLF
jgi:hypothetical protein